MEFFYRYKKLAAILAIITVSVLVLFTFFGGREEEQLSTPDKVEARQLALSFSTDERIDKIMVQAGEHVNKGDLLATLHAEALLESIEDDKKIIQAQEKLIRELEQEILRDEKQIAVLHSQLKGLRVNLLLKERKLRESIIFAPENGVIYEILFQPGDMVVAQQPVYYLVADGDS